MCKLMKIFCKPCGRWQTPWVNYCPKVDKSWTPWMPCYGPNVVFLFQTDHITTVYNGLCAEHQRQKEELEKEMEELQRLIGESDLLGVREEANKRMNELESLLGGVRMGDKTAQGDARANRA